MCVNACESVCIHVSAPVHVSDQLLRNVKLKEKAMTILI